MKRFAIIGWLVAAFAIGYALRPVTEASPNVEPIVAPAATATSTSAWLDNYYKSVTGKEAYERTAPIPTRAPYLEPVPIPKRP